MPISLGNLLGHPTEVYEHRDLTEVKVQAKDSCALLLAIPRSAVPDLQLAVGGAQRVGLEACVYQSFPEKRLWLLRTGGIPVVDGVASSSPIEI